MKFAKIKFLTYLIIQIKHNLKDIETTKDEVILNTEDFEIRIKAREKKELIPWEVTFGKIRTFNIIDLMLEIECAYSKTEARRMINKGLISFDKKKIFTNKDTVKIQDEHSFEIKGIKKYTIKVDKNF